MIYVGARRRRATGSGRRRCSARAGRSSGSAGRGRSSCSSRRRPPSSSSSLPLTLATSAIGIYSLTVDAGLGAARLRDPVPRRALASRSSSPCRRRSSGSGCSGSCSPRRFVLYRNANALSNMLEWPVLLVTGMLVPLSLLPGWASADRLGARPDLGRRRRSARRRSAARRGRTIGMTLALGCVYLAIGAVCLRHFEGAARRARDPLADMTRAFVRDLLRRRR